MAFHDLLQHVAWQGSCTAVHMRCHSGAEVSENDFAETVFAKLEQR